MQSIFHIKAHVCGCPFKDWQDVPLTLETAAPTFSVGVPTPHPWTLSIIPVATRERGWERESYRHLPVPLQTAVVPPPMIMAPSAAPAVPMVFRSAAVSSKGNVSATFSIPGTITIPSDLNEHNVTIIQLKLDAIISWLAVPKLDSKTHISVSPLCKFDDPLLIRLDRLKLGMRLNTIY